MSRLIPVCGLLFALCLALPADEVAAQDPYERLRDAYLVTGTRFRNAFREVVAPTRESTIQIRDGDGKPVVLGVVLSADGEILTKASELPEEFRVQFSDRRELPGTLLAKDESYDLALVKVEATDLHPVSWKPQALTEGQWLITPGMSDSPLAIGVMSVQPRKIPDTGIHGVLGIELERNGAATIRRVFENSGAANADLRTGDVILELNDREMPTGGDVIATVRKFRPGETLALKIRRDEELLDVSVTLTHPFGDFLSRIAMQDQLGGALSDRRDNFPSALQHDAVLRPRDCGGPVLNLDGEAVALNIARAGRTVTYAIPAADVQRVVDKLHKSSSAGQPR